jgi:hypothetical protein
MHGMRRFSQLHKCLEAKQVSSLPPWHPPHKEIKKKESTKPTSKPCEQTTCMQQAHMHISKISIDLKKLHM